MDSTQVIENEEVNAQEKPISRLQVLIEFFDHRKILPIVNAYRHIERVNKEEVPVTYSEMIKSLKQLYNERVVSVIESFIEFYIDYAILSPEVAYSLYSAELAALEMCTSEEFKEVNSVEHVFEEETEELFFDLRNHEDIEKFTKSGSFPILVATSNAIN